jgi:perosamine synthetase
VASPIAQARTVPLFHADMTAGMEAAVIPLLKSGQLASGPKVAEFEQRFGEAIGRQHVVCTSDMTSALTLALRLAGVGAGDEVATLAYSCMSSNAPIALVGATPVWIDIDSGTAAMSPADLECAIGPRTKAVMLYHVAGYPGPAAEIAAICRRRGLVLVEDCNNALGASQDGSPVGQFGDFAVHSFYPNRQINALDGGALSCPDAKTAERARRLRRFGIDTSSFRDSNGEINPASDIAEIGWSAGFPHVNAALGLAQLPLLADRMARTRNHARRLLAALDGTRRIVPVRARAGAMPAYWGFLARAERRDELLVALKGRGIHASRLHHRNDDYSGYAARRRPLPGTDAWTRSVIALPCGWWLEEAQLDELIETLVREEGA